MKREKTDLFNFDTVDTNDNEGSNRISEPEILMETVSQPKRWFGLGLRDLLILAVCVILGVAYLFWPNTQVQQSSARFAPSEPKAWNSAYQKTEPGVSTMPLVVDPNTLSVAAEALTTFKKEIATILEARRSFAEENREAIGAISERLALANQQVKQLEQQLSDMAIRLESVRTQPAASKQRVSTPVKKRTQNPQRASTDGYQINTLWQGMAWVSYKGSTHAVREGDTLGKLKIKHIDVSKRQIETSAGIIR
ncbi:conjugal transfer protein TraP (plasmid) [Candidatus Fukatsuia symbiotica]|uniref:Conjugal transfer protein TraP n=1 Tax=Candidatus Fukatsuia symbiotica TaxID=1878942 RepID=A0A2U8I8K7_9GAMM|nr:conjugal transfer protein TraP [Candidatus Fukatsuia symbiotica]AWK15491.1 hypothetical protein CCS41_13735 [Candidatus Fukatsuia symbiotica]MEA9445879.1 conjugal transfer protein TraP [Candidatus Fukatsuia symbiotica]